MDGVYSVNERADDLLGRRLTPEEERSGVLAIDFPAELGYQCPIHKRTLRDEARHDPLQWSEYSGFLWCPECDRDWPSALCVPLDREPDPDRPWVNAGPEMAITIFLDTVAQACNRALYMAAHEQP